MVHHKKIGLFLLSSCLAFCIDYAIFSILYFFTSNVILSTIFARMISASANYFVNKYLVFQTSNKNYNFKNYVLLAISILSMNCVLIYLFVTIFNVPAYSAKLIVEVGLYFMSFYVQNYFVCKE